jgi:hypothetical protein
VSSQGTDSPTGKQEEINKMKMPFLLLLALFLVALALLPADVFAQSSGTVNITGRVDKAAAMRWWTFSAINTEIGTNAPAVQNGPLDFTLDVSDVAAGNNNNTYAGGTVQLMLRSNTTFNLDAQVTASSGFGAAAAGDAALSDVGFGIGGLANSGAKVFGDPATGSTITAAFANDPSAAAKDVDEEPIFTSTLADIAASGSPNNGMLVDCTYAIGPQFYTPANPISATVTFTLATP